MTPQQEAIFLNTKANCLRLWWDLRMMKAGLTYGQRVNMHRNTDYTTLARNVLLRRAPEREHVSTFDLPEDYV